MEYIGHMQMEEDVFILQQLQRYSDIAGLRVCDIGCGQGELAYRLSLFGAKVTGVDLSEKLLEYARNRTDQVSWIFAMMPCRFKK